MIRVFLQDGQRLDLPDVVDITPSTSVGDIAFCDAAGHPVWQFRKSDLIGWTIDPPWHDPGPSEPRDWDVDSWPPPEWW